VERYRGAAVRIFVGYGYNERDKWIEELVFPLVVAFGCEVAHGKAVYGGALSDEVIKSIRSADAMIGFTTRRELVPPDRYRTHPWVIQEMTAAHVQVPSIPWVEVREDGVDSPGGILDAVNAQRIDYFEADRAACLVRIAEALRRFHDLANVTTIRLGPIAAADQIGALLDDPLFECSFQILRGTTLLPAERAQVLPIKGALCVKLRGVARGDLVRITISTRGRRWRSDYESVDTVDVQVKE
jgi:hypothetical protein